MATKRHILAISLIVVAALLVYSNTFYASFHLDDMPHIVKNPKIKNLKNLPELLQYQRGVTIATFALNYWVGGLNVFGYHLVNIIIHIINGILVYFFIYLTLQRLASRVERWDDAWAKSIAIYAALLFVVHPIQTQAVTYIVQRMESLSSLFYLLALLLFIKGATATKMLSRVFFYSGVVGSYLLGFYSKEIAITLPVIILLYDFYFIRCGDLKSMLKRWPLYAIMVILMVLFTVITFTSVSGFNDVSGASVGFDVKTVTPFQYLLTQFNVVLTYIRLLFLPINQNLDYNYPISKTFFEFPTFASFLAILAILGLAVFLFKQSRTAGKPYSILISFFILWFFIILSPTSSIVPVIDVIFEHRLYLASVGFMVIFVILFDMASKAVEMQFRRPLVFVLILSLLSIATYKRNLIWTNELTLWADTVKKSPENARAHASLGVAFYERGMLDEAIMEYKEALRLRPFALPHWHYNLAMAYYKKGLLDEAIFHYKKAIDYGLGNNADIHNNLGNVYAEKGLLKEAVSEYKEALRIEPDHSLAIKNLNIITRMLEQEISTLKNSTTKGN